jgi:hypothetical protein
MMPDGTYTYAPLNQLKPVAEDVWIVDGPTIRFGLPLFKMPFPTRATILRLADDNLFIHSPTPLLPELRAGIEKIGLPRWIVGPNRLHYWWIPEWRAAYPDAEIYLAPKIKSQAGGRLDFDCAQLDRQSGYPWDARVATLPITGSYMTEVEFFHFASRTLVMTDLIENFEAQKLETLAMRLLTWVGGVQDPNGSTPRDMRMSFSKGDPALQAAIRKMIDWNPERVILAHGRWYDSHGQDELRRAFRWILER